MQAEDLGHYTALCVRPWPRRVPRSSGHSCPVCRNLDGATPISHPGRHEGLRVEAGTREDVIGRAGGHSEWVTATTVPDSGA